MNLRMESVSDGKIITRTELVDIEDVYDFITANNDQYSIHELLFNNVRKMHFYIEFENSDHPLTDIGNLNIFLNQSLQ